ncbi:MAG: ATP synthase F1 subunit gamma [Chloroflexota bacterium]|nr:ATP synthase F1 subunit gamma [Chloroflexota bacterium]
MPSERDIRTRIRSVRNVSQITRAMEMVAASKMRRAQQRVGASRPYSERLRAMLADVAAMASGADAQEYPLLRQRPVRRVEVILVTGERGLAGSLNSNIIRRTTRFLVDEMESQHVEAQLITVGRKGRDFMRRYQREIAAEFIAIGDRPTLAEVTPIARIAMDDYINERVDAVYIAYTRYVNTLTQRPELVKILPIEPPEEQQRQKGKYGEYLFEPSAGAVLEQILPRFVEISVYQAILESIASYYSAQMVAMRNATDNAKTVVSELRLALNKARQTRITNEVAEISAGANALGEVAG